MSSIVRAFLIRELLDHECVEEALKVMKCQYEKQGSIIKVNENLSISLTSEGAKLDHVLQESWQQQDLNSFIETLTKTYATKLEQKIERLKLEEARTREDETLKLFEKEERRVRELELRKERMRLEAIRRREDAALRRKIAEKATAITQRAERLGYIVREEITGKERVLVLVRR